MFTTTESGYSIPTPAPEPGAAYTTDLPADYGAPAIDASKALVMAEMPSATATASTPDPPSAPSPASDAGELRIANVPAAEVEAAPQSFRAAAIAKLLADKNRKPKTENKPCWDRPDCREVQLGIPSPLPSSVETLSEPTTASTLELSQESPTESVDAPTQTSADSLAESPAGTATDTPTGTPTDSMIF